MIPENIYEIGGLLGLEHKDIQDLVPDESNSDTTKNLKVPFSPVNTYKGDPGELYGTISINDF